MEDIENFVNNIAHSTLGNAWNRLTYIDNRYMTLPIQDGFNWTESFTDFTSGEWYLVVFRSRYRADTDYQTLTERDERAHAEARQSAGFLYYFMGTPDEDGHCLSFCLWENQHMAQLASRRPKHQEALQLVASAYEYYHLERYFVTKTTAPDGSGLDFERLPIRSDHL